ncbi:hypothetical protein P3X46_016259 [Hevea brasiliensis]|uniref:Cleavage/polyadenylation specificity factor A subunit N-terminal domain-containing protein n=2 Tax=Hevea brasiliensis TaxID=3981 RepID=A0ABQ9LZX2_HEVBR|nr:uncharacterized protein LOC110647859 isoform X2 [Hevea brasiliensis]KAJ9173085.1 hypothetical protein P3X46_016259 [Hevea brasiliensis]
MVLVQSSKLSLPSSSTQTNSFLLEPNSLSLALMHSDSSLSLFPSLPFPSLTSLPSKPQTLIPPPSSSSSFILLHHHHLAHPRVLFLVAGPHKGGSQILLRFYILKSNNVFSKSQVVCNQKGLGFDSKFGVLVDVNHGVSIKVVGSINFFVMYSVSNRNVWVFALKPIGDGDGDGVGDAVKLMRCAVIECCLPVWSISISFGYLILGEDNGVRVFNLRQLVKGNVKRVKSSNSNGNLDFNGKLDSKGLRLPNGVIGGDHHSSSIVCNGSLDAKIDKHYVSVKHRSVRCRHDSGEGGACFVAFKSKEVEGSKSTVKAVSIQALSPKNFMILDSTGDLHMLCLSNPVGGSNISSHMMHLPHSMKVQKLAVLPDISSRIQTFWISDGFHSVHMMTASEMDPVIKNDGDESQEKLMQISVIQAIFAAEKIQDLVPLAANAFLILGQGNVWAYAIP